MTTVRDTGVHPEPACDDLVVEVNSSGAASSLDSRPVGGTEYKDVKMRGRIIQSRRRD